MPKSAPKACLHRGCNQYATVKGYCQQHQRESRKYDQERGNANERGYDSDWRKARAVYLGNNCYCVACRKKNRLTPANVVDHIIPHKGDDILFADETNWQALCTSCHNAKTAKEDMGSWSPKK